MEGDIVHDYAWTLLIMEVLGTVAAAVQLASLISTLNNIWHDLRS